MCVVPRVWRMNFERIERIVGVSPDGQSVFICTCFFWQIGPSSSRSDGRGLSMEAEISDWREFLLIHAITVMMGKYSCQSWISELELYIHILSDTGLDVGRCGLVSTSTKPSSLSKATATGLWDVRRAYMCMCVCYYYYAITVVIILPNNKNNNRISTVCMNCIDWFGAHGRWAYTFISFYYMYIYIYITIIFGYLERKHLLIASFFLVSLLKI